MKCLKSRVIVVLALVPGVIGFAASAAEVSRTLAVTAAPDKDYRVALVIGNSRYPSGALADPKNDAKAWQRPWPNSAATSNSNWTRPAPT